MCLLLCCRSSHVRILSHGITCRVTLLFCLITMTKQFPDHLDGICPAMIPCVCQEEHSVSCAYKRLKTLPDFLVFDKVWNELDISENFLTRLGSNGFLGVKVINLRLDRNTIRQLEGGSFNGLDMLESLDLSHNSLTSLPARIFDHLTKLSTLRIQYNDLTVLDEWSMAGIPQLYELDLMGNSFRAVPTSALCKITHLKKLILRDNILHILSPYAFYGLSLDYLDLGSNRVPLVIDPDAFCGLDPHVVSTDPGSITWEGLTTLRLDHSGLTTLDPCITRRIWTLSELDISGNPLHCDCSIFLLKDYGVKTAYPGAQCASPQLYAGLPLQSIKADVYQCKTKHSNNSRSCQTSLCTNRDHINMICTSSGQAIHPSFLTLVISLTIWYVLTSVKISTVKEL